MLYGYCGKFLKKWKIRNDVGQGLGQISLARRCIESTPGGEKLVHSAAYRTGPKAQEYKKTEIDKMLERKKIEPTETEWATPIFLLLKEYGSLRFFCGLWKVKVRQQNATSPDYPEYMSLSTHSETH